MCTSMLAGPASRKMPVAIGMLKNVGYLDRISNRISSISVPQLSLFVLFPFPRLTLLHIPASDLNLASLM